LRNRSLSVLAICLGFLALSAKPLAAQDFAISSASLSQASVTTYSEEARHVTVTVTIIRSPNAQNVTTDVSGQCQSATCGFDVVLPPGVSAGTQTVNIGAVGTQITDTILVTVHNMNGTIADQKQVPITLLPNTPSVSYSTTSITPPATGTATITLASPLPSDTSGAVPFIETSPQDVQNSCGTIQAGGQSVSCTVSGFPVSQPTPVTLTPWLNIFGPNPISANPVGSPTTVTVFPNSQEPSLPCGSGSGSCAAQAGHPINLINGNVWITQRDYSLPGLGGGLSLDRTWNSLWPQQQDSLPAAGMFGDSWRSTYEERIASSGANFIKYYRSNGDGWWFSFNSTANAYLVSSPPNERASLQFNGTTQQYTITFADGSSRIFSSSGFLTKIQDRNANQVSVTYDTSGRISQVTDAASRSITFTYGNSSFPSLVTSAADSVGNIATYTYDSISRVTNITYPDASQLNFTYAAGTLIGSITDAQGKVIESHTYDSSRRGLTSQRANGVEAITVSYPSAGATTLTDSLSNTTNYAYTTVGLSKFVNSVTGPTCVTCGATNTGSFTFDSNANPTSSTDANSNITNYTYDSQGNILTRSNVIGLNTLTWTYTYNSFNQVLTATDSLGHTTTNTYDTHGNLLTTTTPSPDGTTAGSVTTFTYDTKGQLLTVKDPRNNTTTIVYTTAGLISTITDAQSKVTTYTYDNRGNRLTAKDALNNTTSFTYDVMNRLTKITYPDNTTNQFAYDTRGRRTSVTDGNSKVTTYAYDDADRLTTVTDAATHATNYAYDTESNLTSITDANNHQTSFTYNANRWVTRTTFPSTLTENYTYDLNGNLHTKTDRKNQLITYTYDQLNRLTQKSYPDSTNVTYTYDNASRLTQVVDPTGTYSFTFDNMGRLTGTTTQYSFLTSRTFTTAYAYDAASNRTSFTDPESGTTSYAYDTLNRLQTLTQPSAFSSSGNFGFTYDALSRRTALNRPNSVNTTYSYDTLSRLLNLTHKKATTTLDGATYTVDNAGNRTSRQALPSNTTLNYTYDSIYEILTSKQGTTTKETYTYDAVGNRLSSLNVSPYNYNSSNELTGFPSFTFTYDNNGNTLNRTANTTQTPFTWDFENRLVSVTVPAGGTNGILFNYQYDPFGRRIKSSMTVGSTTTSIFAYDGDNLIEETNSTGSVVARYVQGLNIDEPLAMLRSSATSYYEADGLGSITSLSNSSGAIANTYTYDSFGNLTASTGSLINPFRFTAREFDGSGFYFYRARYYDPQSGRFLSEDPIGFNSGINFYRYVANNPSNLIDPSGLLQVCCRSANLGNFVTYLGFMNLLPPPCHCFLKTDFGTLGGYHEGSTISRPLGNLVLREDDRSDSDWGPNRNSISCETIPGSKCENDERAHKAFHSFPRLLGGYGPEADDAGTSNDAAHMLLNEAGFDYKLPSCAWGKHNGRSPLTVPRIAFPFLFPKSRPMI